MRRRAVIAGFVGAAALPPIVRAQQPPMPAIGFLDSRFPDALGDRLRGFRLGLKLAGYAEGENVAAVTVSLRIKRSGCRRWQANWSAGRNRCLSRPTR